MGKGLKQTFLKRRHTNDQQKYEKMTNIISNQGNAQRDITSNLSEWILSKDKR